MTISQFGLLVSCVDIHGISFLWGIILILISVGAVEAKTVDVYLAAGQSNARLTWADAIESKLTQLNSGAECIVVHSAHPGHWMNRWWNDDGAQQNYWDNVAALDEAIFTIESNGDTPHLKGIFWFQGEGDTGNLGDINAYQARFVAYLESLQEHYKAPGLFAAITIIDANDDPYVSGVLEVEHSWRFESVWLIEGNYLFSSVNSNKLSYSNYC